MLLLRWSRSRKVQALKEFWWRCEEEERKSRVDEYLVLDLSIVL